ncbi:hypothetical protein YC2023_114213 [Brassica napus]
MNLCGFNHKYCICTSKFVEYLIDLSISSFTVCFRELFDSPYSSVVAGNPAKLMRVINVQDPSLVMKHNEFADSYSVLLSRLGLIILISLEVLSSTRHLAEAKRLLLKQFRTQLEFKVNEDENKKSNHKHSKLILTQQRK